MYSIIKSFLFILLITMMLTTTVKGQDKSSNKCQLVNGLKETGLIMAVKEEGYAIQVSKNWYSITLDNKTAAAWAMLECLNPKGQHIKIYDGYSGKQIGKYGKSSGYTSYE